MNDDRLIRDLHALDRPIAVDPEFADHLFERLRKERRTRPRRLPLLLLAATLLIGASVGAIVFGGGAPQRSETPVANTQTWALPMTEGSVQIEYAIPSDLELTVDDGGTYLAFGPKGEVVHALDGQSTTLPAGARGVKVTNVAGAMAHFSNNHPLGTDAASFLRGLGSHPVLDADLGPILETRLGDRLALRTDVRKTGHAAHLDKGDVMIDLWPQSEIIVADAKGGSIVLVQVWAATEEDLAAWRPDAERLVASFRLIDGG